MRSKNCTISLPSTLSIHPFATARFLEALNLPLPLRISPRILPLLLLTQLMNSRGGDLSPASRVSAALPRGSHDAAAAAASTSADARHSDYGVVSLHLEGTRGMLGVGPILGNGEERSSSFSWNLEQKAGSRSSNFPWTSERIGGRSSKFSRNPEQRAGEGDQRWGEKRRGRDASETGDESIGGGGWRGGRGGRGGGNGRFMSWSRRGGGDRAHQGNEYNIRARRAGDERDFTSASRVSRSWPGFEEHRYWCSAEKELLTPHEKFVLVSYNILAIKNAAEHRQQLYGHLPWQVMHWDQRKIKLMRELGSWSPDIMCLQEVDMFEDLVEELQKSGYLGAYTRRTGGAGDGCAMFWKNTRFRLLQEESIHFKDHGLRNNVAQLCVFQSVHGEAEMKVDVDTQLPNSGEKRGRGNVVIVGNIHVLFNPKRGDIKLGQVRVLLESAHTLSEKWGDCPVAIAGDFNSTPMSDVYKFIANSELDISGLNRTTMSGQVEACEGAFPPRSWVNPASFSNSEGPESSKTFVKDWSWTAEELEAATGTSDCTILRHNLKLRSAYPQIKGEVGCRDAQDEPLVTTYHQKFMGTVDYIWHSEGIDTMKVLDTLPVNVLQRLRGLPSQKWGSDHLALACELALLPSPELR